MRMRLVVSKVHYNFAVCNLHERHFMVTQLLQCLSTNKLTVVVCPRGPAPLLLPRPTLLPLYRPLYRPLLPLQGGGGGEGGGGGGGKRGGAAGQEEGKS